MLNDFQKLFRYLFRHPKWRIGIARSTPREIILKGLDSCLFKWLEFNNSEVNADPFVFKQNGNRYIFYENLDYKNNLKKICWVRIDDNFEASEQGEANGLPSNASYPFLLEHANSVYCIPEAHKENNISLYISTLFPSQWKKVKTLIDDIKGIDPTLYRHNGKWWLFYSDKDDKPNEKLRLSFSDELLGPYQLHPDSPIVADKSLARPAGNLLNIDNKLFRPGQDCSDKYGKAVAINEIDELNESSYREKKRAVLFR